MTSCRLILSVITLVINKSDSLLHGRTILFITSMITDRIGRREVILPLLMLLRDKQTSYVRSRPQECCWDFKAHLNKDFFDLMLFQIPFVDL